MSGITHVVLDLETFGTEPDSAVVSIGAVILHRRDPASEFSAVIDNPQGHIDPAAVRWWLAQRVEVRAAITGLAAGEREALGAFMRWLNDEVRGQGTPDFPREIRIWGSEDFDTVILANAYRRLGATVPWGYQTPRGMRTILEAAGVDEDAIPWGELIEHRALDCARHAAIALDLALGAIEGALANA